MTMSAVPTDLARRLERFRAAQGDQGNPDGPLPHRRITAVELAERLATTLDGEVVETPTGRFVRIEGRATDLPVDRVRLAGLPGHPPPGRPLVCLDTETTGLATATGTVAFLIGLGWWDGPAFKQIQLLLPDHGEEPALLDELARHLPPDAWLVTYNGRGFDWPLLVTRYRLARRAAPWDPQRVATDRAHLLRRLGRTVDATEAWRALAAGPGRTAIVASIELAKLQEHRLGRPDLALESAVHGRGLAERRRQLGMPEPALEADLRTRLARLRRRTASADGGIRPGSPAG